VNHAKYAQSASVDVNETAKIRAARCAVNPTVRTRPRLATVEQAAAYLAFGDPDRPAVRSVWRLIERQDLTPIRLPGMRRTFVEWAELDRLVDRAREDA
jgi:hypothetical protein